MSLQSIMQRVGGLRGLAAGAAIAWGTAQAQTIATQAQEEAQAAQELLAERQAEVERIHAERDAILDSMRKEARAYIVMDVQAGKYDATVGMRATSLGWTPPPSEPDPAPVLPAVETAGPYPKPYVKGAKPLPSVGDPATNEDIDV